MNVTSFMTQVVQVLCQFLVCTKINSYPIVFYNEYVSHGEKSEDPYMETKLLCWFAANISRQIKQNPINRSGVVTQSVEIRLVRIISRPT